MPSSVEDNWDSLLSPFDECKNTGREKGRKAGEQTGHQEGRHLGRTTGTEYGMELGFYRGSIDSIEPNLLNEKSKKTKDALIGMLDSFPSPNSLFIDSKLLPVYVPANEDDLDDTEREESTVAAQLQRIRVRFKLLAAQLGISNFNLTQVMKLADETQETGLEASHEW